MNNKLFARIMTAVICICMMSTVVFAADPVLTIDGNTATMSFLVGTEGADISKNTAEDQITMMAYLVDEAAEAVPAYTDQKIVAINQVAGAAGFGNVLIDASKLETGKKIAVVLGGSDGTTESFFAVEETPAPTTYTVTYELNGGTVDPANATTFTSETVDAFLEALADPTKADLVVDTETETTTTVYTFAGWYLDAEFTTAATAENVALVTTTAITLYAKYDEATTSVPKEPAGGEDVVVTVMNGTTAIELTADAAGNVTLPVAGEIAVPYTTTVVDSAKNAFAFTLHSWIAVPNDAVISSATTYQEYTTTVNVADLEGKTLYAKYATGMICGDINGDGSIAAIDVMRANVAANKQVYADNANKPIFAGATAVVGDVNGDGTIAAIDVMRLNVAANKSVYADNSNKNIFAVKDTVLYR